MYRNEGLSLGAQPAASSKWARCWRCWNCYRQWAETAERPNHRGPDPGEQLPDHVVPALTMLVVGAGRDKGTTAIP